MVTVYCKDCFWSGPASDCKNPELALENISPGEVFAHGACPVCRGDCHDEEATARKSGPELLDALRDAVREIQAITEYGRRTFGDEWWPATDKKYIRSVLDLVSKERYEDVIARAQVTLIEKEPDEQQGAKP